MRYYQRPCPRANEKPYCEYMVNGICTFDKERRIREREYIRAPNGTLIDVTSAGPGGLFGIGCLPKDKRPYLFPDWD